MLKAPFPWFGYRECIGQSQFDGCLPALLTALFVLHRIAFRAAINPAMDFAANSLRCSARCSFLLFSSRFSSASFSLLRSLWWTAKPSGIAPFTDAHLNCASSTHLFGSATFIKALFSPFLLCLVRILIAPTGNLFSAGIPSVNLPLKSLITMIIHNNYDGGNVWS